MTHSTTEPIVAGLLLAAGGGRRLGGRPKALLSHHGRPLIEHALRALHEGGCGPVHIVLGAAADRVRTEADLPGAVLVDNPHWADGMGSSLRAGLESLAGTAADAALVCLVDQPGIGAPAVARIRSTLLSRYDRESRYERHGWAGREGRHDREGDPGPTDGVPAALIAASYDGERGHPVLLGADHWRAVAASAVGDRGARAYLAGHSSALTLVECGDIAEGYDIDTPEDLVHLDRHPPH